MTLSSSVILIALAALSGLSPTALVAAAEDECRPSTWAASANRGAPTSPPGPEITRHPESQSAKNAAPGDVNCRYWAETGEDVNYYTCTELAERYEITVDKFFQLNPGVDEDCSNLKPSTEYCVDGCEGPPNVTP